MKRLQLNKSGMEASGIAVGTWSFGGDSSSYWGLQTQEAVDSLVSKALDEGINLFDTAIAYNQGKSEDALGRALEGKRDKAVIINKIPVQSMEELPFAEQKIYDSLKRLRTDYIDIMMMHWPSKNPEQMAGNLDVLKRLRDKGCIREIGVSNFGPGALEFAKKQGVDVVLNEIAYNLMTRGAEFSVLPYCQQNDIKVAAYMPLMQGILTGRYMSVSEIPAQRRRTLHFSQENNPAIRHGGNGYEKTLEKLLVDLRALAEETGIEARVLCMAWLQQIPEISVTMVGCRSIEQLDENIAATKVVLSQDVVDSLNRISENLKQEMGSNMDLWQGGENSRVF